MSNFKDTSATKYQQSIDIKSILQGKRKKPPYSKGSEGSDGSEGSKDFEDFSDWLMDPHNRWVSSDERHTTGVPVDQMMKGISKNTHYDPKLFDYLERPTMGDRNGDYTKSDVDFLNEQLYYWENRDDYVTHEFLQESTQFSFSGLKPRHGFIPDTPTPDEKRRIAYIEDLMKEKKKKLDDLIKILNKKAKRTEVYRQEVKYANQRYDKETAEIKQRIEKQETADQLRRKYQAIVHNPDTPVPDDLSHTEEKEFEEALFLYLIRSDLTPKHILYILINVFLKKYSEFTWYKNKRVKGESNLGKYTWEEHEMMLSVEFAEHGITQFHRIKIGNPPEFYKFIEKICIRLLEKVPTTYERIQTKYSYIIDREGIDKTVKLDDLIRETETLIRSTSTTYTECDSGGCSIMGGKKKKTSKKKTSKRKTSKRRCK